PDRMRMEEARDESDAQPGAVRERSAADLRRRLVVSANGTAKLAEELAIVARVVGEVELREQHLAFGMRERLHSLRGQLIELACKPLGNLVDLLLRLQDHRHHQGALEARA